MNKFGFFGIFIAVCVAHLFALQSQFAKKSVIAKPKAKVHHITLSKVNIKKPKPIVKPKPKPKPKPKKIVKKQKVIKPIVLPKPEPVVQAVEPILKQVITPVAVIDTTSIKDKYTSEIRRQIQQNLIYPKIAKRLRMQGVVKMTFRVVKNGTITKIKTTNAPKKLLEKGAVKTLKSLSLKPIPTELKEDFLDITIPIEFKLKG